MPGTLICPACGNTFSAKAAEKIAERRDLCGACGGVLELADREPSPEVAALAGVPAPRLNGRA